MLPGTTKSAPIDFRSLRLTDPDIYEYLGYGSAVPQDAVKDMVSEMKENIAGLVRPLYGFSAIEGFALDKEHLSAGGKQFSPGKIITHYLKDADFFLILIATAGWEYAHWQEEIMAQGDPVASFIADALGSALVEAVSARVIDDLRQELSQSGLGLSNSYSPGYCGWPLSEQKELFSLLPPRFCEVELTDSCLMMPIKSTSSLLAVGSKIQPKPYGCSICRKKDCYKRRLKPSPTTHSN